MVNIYTPDFIVFKKYLLSTCKIPSTVLGARDQAKSKTKFLALMRHHIVEETTIKLKK